MSRQGKIKVYLWAGRKDRELMMKDLGDERGQNSCCIQSNSASRAMKTVTPVLTVNTKTHLMYFNLMSKYKTGTWK